MEVDIVKSKTPVQTSIKFQIQSFAVPDQGRILFGTRSGDVGLVTLYYQGLGDQKEDIKEDTHIQSQGRLGVKCINKIYEFCDH